ncbi:hypothetical protein HK101_009999 [Irineochytrium annulatum]|nr:hypothetical protein HK101_009999 [Irineochytrium annulatum]
MLTYDMITIVFIRYENLTQLPFKGAAGGIAMMFGRKLAIFPAYCMITEGTAITHNLLWYVQTFTRRRAVQKAPTPTAPSTASDPAAVRVPAPSAQEEAQPPTELTTNLLALRAVSFVALRSWCGPWSIAEALWIEGGIVPFFRKLFGEIEWWISWPGLAMITMFRYGTNWFVPFGSLTHCIVVSVLNAGWTHATIKAWLKARKKLRAAKRK